MLKINQLLLPVGAFLIMFLVGLGCFTTTAKADTLEVDKERFVPIKGDLVPPMLGSVIQKLESLQQDKLPIYILINSSGGWVRVGDAISSAIVALQKADIPAHCFVDGIAFSAAFYIYNVCKYRYAMTTSKLGWHNAAVQFAPFSIHTVESLKQEIADLEAANLKYQNNTTGVTGMSADFYQKWAKTARKWKAPELYEVVPNKNYLKLINEWSLVEADY